MRASLIVAVLMAAWPSAALAQEKQPDARPDPTTAKAAAAAPARNVSLAQTLQVAVRQSPTLADATIDVAVAEASLLSSSGIEDFVLAASGLLTLRRDESSRGAIRGDNDSDVVELDANISKLLWTGARVSVNATGVRSRSVFPTLFDDDDDPVTPDILIENEDVEYTTAVNATIVQPLLRGRGEIATRAEQIRARYGLDAARLGQIATARNLIRDVIISYWNVALAHRDLAIRKSSLDLAFERRRLTESRVKLGNAAPTELNAVDQIIATTKEEVLLAELAITEASLQLRQLAGLEIGPGELDLQTAEIVASAKAELDLDSLLTKAYANSAELAALEQEGKGAKLDVEVTENGLLPQLDFRLGGGPIGTADSAGKALSNLGSFKGYSITAGLELSYALGNNAAEGAAHQARENLRRVSINREDLRRQIAVAVVRAVNSARTADQRMELSQQAIELSEKNIEAEQRRFELGRSTNFDVLQRQEELKQAQLRFSRATIDYIDALAQIDALTGDILTRYGIKLGDEL